MFNFIKKLLTKNKSQIPLFYVTFDYNKYKQGKLIKNCLIHYHPILKDDVILREQIGEVIDYIREKYNMEEL